MSVSIMSPSHPDYNLPISARDSSCATISGWYQHQAQPPCYSGGYVVWLTFLDLCGLVVDVPCTQAAAEVIEQYDSHVELRLTIRPSVLENSASGDAELVPLCVNAVRAV